MIIIRIVIFLFKIITFVEIGDRFKTIINL